MRVISGIAKGKRLKSSDIDTLRPTSDKVKESLFNIMAPFINSDMIVGDFFAGTGNVGIEFLSRGVKEVVFVDKDIRCINIIKENLKITNFDKNAKIIRYDVIKFIQSSNCPMFDVIFIDPPYRSNLAYISAKNILCYDILKKDGFLIIEALKDFEFINDDLKLYREKVYGDTKLLIYNYGGY